jgi:hypothetical protein
MGMTADELSKMTIGDLEEAAARVGAALKVLREAGAWAPKTETPHQPLQEWQTRPPGVRSADEPARPLSPGPAVRMSPEELALRNRLLRQNLPDDIAAMEAT